MTAAAHSAWRSAPAKPSVAAATLPITCSAGCGFHLHFIILSNPQVFDSHDAESKHLQCRPARSMHRLPGQIHLKEFHNLFTAHAPVIFFSTPHHSQSGTWRCGCAGWQPGLRRRAAQSRPPGQSALGGAAPSRSPQACRHQQHSSPSCKSLVNGFTDSKVLQKQVTLKPAGGVRGGRPSVPFSSSQILFHFGPHPRGTTDLPIGQV